MNKYASDAMYMASQKLTIVIIVMFKCACINIWRNKFKKFEIFQRDIRAQQAYCQIYQSVTSRFKCIEMWLM